MNIWTFDATTTAKMVADRSISATEAVESHLRRIDEVNPRLNAIVRRTDDDARTTAHRIDGSSLRGPLAGVAITTKINTDHVPYPNDNGIRALANNPSIETNRCIAGLLDADAAMVGRTNSPAFAMRFHTANDLHGETLNPYDREISCGGSSGGAGVAVATGMCQIAQGNDVAGSVRWPAYMNGVIGLRPTVHRMPTGGTNPAIGRAWTASEMSTNGVIARTMSDIRLGYRAMCTENWSDPNWIPAPHSFPDQPNNKRAAIVTNDGHSLSPETIDAVRRAGIALEDAGYIVDEVTPPNLETFFTLWQRLGSIDILLGLRPMLNSIGDEGLRASIEDWAGNFPPPTAETFMNAMIERDLLVREWTNFLASYPVVVTPLMARTTIPRGFDVDHEGAMAELVHTGRWGFNLSAIAMPALAFPMGLNNGQPIGIQMFARTWREDILLDAGDALEAKFGSVSVTDIRW
ncbi:MAG: hypothetical protein RJB08_1854 [Actinomycetota bacterium]